MYLANWSELIKSRKSVITNDKQDCGNIVSEKENYIVVEDGSTNPHYYKVPKDKIDGYDGSVLSLNVAYDELKHLEKESYISRSTVDNSSITRNDTMNRIDLTQENHRKSGTETKLKSTLFSTLKRQIPYLIGGTITGIIMGYYYGWLFSIVVNSAIWFAISYFVNRFYWKYTGFKEEMYLIKFALSKIHK